jgi:dTDP-4-amino-4,6-dideoxygalactose transaminase
LYAILLDTRRLKVDRNRVVSALLAENIGASVHFWPIHMQPYYSEKYGYSPEDLPVAARVGRSLVSLPLMPQMSDADACDVVTAVGKVLRAYAR